jgi:hypothetical protein
MLLAGIDKKTERSLFLVAIALSLLIILPQCIAQQRISLTSNSGDFNQEANRHIHAGSSIVEVKQFLELNEFECSNRFEEQRNGADESCLECSYVVSWLYWLNIYTIRVYSKEGKVTRVHASVEEQKT